MINRGDDNIRTNEWGEVLQRSFVVNDLVREEPGEQDGAYEEENSEEALCFAYEAEAAGVIGMRGKELNVERAYLREEPEPEEEPPEPSELQELQERDAKEEEPPACERD